MCVSHQFTASDMNPCHIYPYWIECNITNCARTMECIHSNDTTWKKYRPLNAVLTWRKQFAMQFCCCAHCFMTQFSIVLKWMFFERAKNRLIIKLHKILYPMVEMLVSKSQAYQTNWLMVCLFLPIAFHSCQFVTIAFIISYSGSKLSALTSSTASKFEMRCSPFWE